MWQYVQLTNRPHLAAPLIMQRLLVSGEDHRHERHKGFDLRAICRAIWRWLAYNRHEGASTIEQQIVRVLTNRFERTLRRKLRELLLATLLSEALPKAAMPRLYLSIGYYGWRMNGFQQACQRLGLRPDTLSLDTAAALVARLKYPEPHLARFKRLQQIDRRRQHLKQLYWHHLANGTYNYLGGIEVNESIQSGRTVRTTAIPIS
jgi:penicillin-binding protein 1A